MQERIKEHDRDVRFARTQTSAVSEHANKTGHHPLWNEVKFIDRDSHWYGKEAIHIRLHPDNINRDNGIEISSNLRLGYFSLNDPQQRFLRPSVFCCEG